MGKSVWCGTRKNRLKIEIFCKLWWSIDVMLALKRIKFSNALFYTCGLKSHSIIRANTKAYFAFQLAKFSSAKYLFFPKKWKNSFCNILLQHVQRQPFFSIPPSLMCSFIWAEMLHDDKSTLHFFQWLNMNHLSWTSWS